MLRFTEAEIQTRVIPENSKFSDNSQIVRALRGALADELSAQNLYSEIIACLKNSGVNGNPGVIDRLQEILGDEMNHSGSLLACIDSLDKLMADRMKQGMEGE